MRTRSVKELAKARAVRTSGMAAQVLLRRNELLDEWKRYDHDAGETALLIALLEVIDKNFKR